MFALQPFSAYKTDTGESSAINYSYILQSSKDVVRHESKQKIESFNEFKAKELSNSVKELTRKDLTIDSPGDKLEKKNDQANRSPDCSILDVAVPSPPSELKKKMPYARESERRLVLNLDMTKQTDESPKSRGNYSPHKS